MAIIIQKDSTKQKDFTRKAGFGIVSFCKTQIIRKNWVRLPYHLIGAAIIVAMIIEYFVYILLFIVAVISIPVFIFIVYSAIDNSGKSSKKQNKIPAKEIHRKKQQNFLESKKQVKIQNSKNYKSKKGFDLNTPPSNGNVFKHWVAYGLDSAKIMPPSSEQGIDVIATIDGKTIGLRCKLWNTPVGKKTVQEAFAGKTFHKTDAVAVMSNAPYTPSAQKLATDTGVKLLSHHDIPNLYEKMFNG